MNQTDYQNWFKRPLNLVAEPIEIRVKHLIKVIARNELVIQSTHDNSITKPMGRELTLLKRELTFLTQRPTI